MSIFNISYFNSQNQFTQISEVPTPSTYQKVRIHGSGYFDDLHGISRVMTQSEISSLDFAESPTWDGETFLLAKFNGNLQAGNITSLPTPITSWLVLRKSKFDSKFSKISEIGVSEKVYIDRLAKSNDNYTYQFIPKATDLLGEPIESDALDTDFNKVILLDPDTEVGYSLCLDMSLSEISTVEDVSINDTRGKYPTMLKGNRNYRVGTVGVLANSNSITEPELTQDIEFLRNLEDFINNGEEKIIKFPKGFTYRVITNNFAKMKKQSLTSQGETIYRISFAYTEIGDLND